MQTVALNPSPLPLRSWLLLRILAPYSAIAGVLITFAYLNGVLDTSFPWVLVSWGYCIVFAFILEYGRLLHIPVRNGLGFRALFMVPAIIQVAQWFVYLQMRRDFTRSIQTLSGLLGIVDLAVVIIGLTLLHSAYKSVLTFKNADNVVSQSSMTVTETQDSSRAFMNLLGQGNGYVDRVIHSVTGRSLRSERMATISLIIMLFLVLIGGMASFGLWAFAHADRISSIETERNKLTVLQAEMQDIKQTLRSGNEEATRKLDRLLQFIDQNYKTSSSYEATLNRLSQQSQSNYADIAIRVTIAVLTIFLVQVFFAVYKYNRHLAIMLAAKAEALELAGSDDDARKELSREAVSIVKETVPAFGAQPRTPIEEIARLAEKVGKR